MNISSTNKIAFWKNPLFIFAISCFFNSSFIVFSKLLGESFTPYELSFYRILIIFTISTIAVITINKKIPTFKKIDKWIVLKALLALLSMITWFITINNLPIAETVAVSFSTPIISSILAVIFLNEKFTVNHLVSFICGVIGMYIIVSPEFGKMDQYALIGVLSCLLLSLSFTIIKKLLNKGYQAIEINYYGNMVMLPIAFALAFTELTMDKNFNEIMLVSGFGFCIFCAEFLHNLSYKKGNVTSLMPLIFLTIILGSLYDYFIFGTVISERVLIGSIIVIIGIVIGNINLKRKKNLAK
jgi:drug/metabolite transporter (DMT)-like permease